MQALFSEPTGAHRGRLWRKVALAAIASLLPLVVVEVIWRFDASAKAREHAEALALLSQPLFPADGEALELQTLLRSNSDPRTLYELRPSLSGYFEGARIVTDARGFRVATPEANADDPAAVQIVGIGDSVMFGWGVEASDAYLPQLEALLAQSFPGVPWKTTNLAVPGYNLAMEVGALIGKGLAVGPDVVIVGWVNNDLDLPNFLRPLPSVRRLNRSFFLDWLRSRMAGRSHGKFSAPGIRIAGGRIEIGAAEYVQELEPGLRHLVGRQAFERSMEELAAAAKEHGFSVVMLIHRGPAPRFLKESCAVHGFPVVTTRPLVRELRQAESVRKGAHPALTLGNGDPHPSAAGHKLVATALRNHFVDSGLGSALAAHAAKPDGEV